MVENEKYFVCNVDHLAIILFGFLSHFWVSFVAIFLFIFLSDHQFKSMHQGGFKCLVDLCVFDLGNSTDAT